MSEKTVTAELQDYTLFYDMLEHLNNAQDELEKADGIRNEIRDKYADEKEFLDEFEGNIAHSIGIDMGWEEFFDYYIQYMVRLSIETERWR